MARSRQICYNKDTLSRVYNVVAYTEWDALQELEMTLHDANDRVIAVANLKGGVGKTTTVLNLAGFAGQMGRRVLAVDTDPQGSLTRVALPDDAPNASLADAFARRARSLDGVRCSSRFAGVDLVPSTLAL